MPYIEVGRSPQGSTLNKNVKGDQVILNVSWGEHGAIVAVVYVNDGGRSLSEFHGFDLNTPEELREMEKALRRARRKLESPRTVPE